MNELTEHYDIPKPNPANIVADDVIKLQEAFDLIDAALFALAGVVAGKAAAGHGHEIADITGLTAALLGKMPADKTFALADLTDVEGAGDAISNYVLTKMDDAFVFRAALSVLGAHAHAIGDVTGLTAALADLTAAIATKAAADATTAALAAKLAKDGGTATGLTVKSYNEVPVDLGTGTAFAPDLADGSMFVFKSSGNFTVTLPDAEPGQSFALEMTYGGAHVPTFAGETLKWDDHAAPDPTSVNNAVDGYAFSCFKAGVWTGYDAGRNIG